MTKGDKLQVRLKDGSGSFPVTVDNLSVCRDCETPIAWCETPKGRKMPVEEAPAPDGIYECHFGRCDKSAAPASKPAANVPPQPTLAERVKKLEDAVFGKGVVRAVVPVVDTTPNDDDSLPF